MTDLRKAAEQALKALEMTKVIFEAEGKNFGLSRVVKAAEALRQALAQPVDAAIVAEVGIWGEELAVKSYCGDKPNYCTPEQEPVGWGSFFFSDDSNPHDHVDTVTNSTNTVQNPHKHKENK